ncbi:hypothetical protein D9758_014759 [Tetrapyrgos nigripes]|uniref:F-box domain-containing protein n=1 Tax=Tetrapyrgos nigripes TaxID=182062 RepID=A0A8H5FFT5_9AGAR|nr:hypothetical protein D9758_014759 [Tetrapyrgos nigripes]
MINTNPSRCNTAQDPELLCAKCHASLSVSPHPNTLDWTSFRSRIHALSMSNECPIDRELDSMRVCLDSAKSKVHSIQEQLRLLDRQRVALEKEMVELSSYITDQDTVLNSIRRLPSEILIPIFRGCVEDGINSKDWDNPLSTRSVRWVIGYVCRRWRGISLDTPELWSDIQIFLDDPTTSRSFTPQSLLLGLHLQRSKQLPLTIGLFSTSYAADLKPNHPLLNTLIPTADRWVRLNVAMSPRLIQRCLFQIKPFLSKSLTLFSTSFTREWDVDDSVCDVLEDAVMLREVVLRYDITSMGIRWENLHSLTLFFDSSSLDDVLSTLNRMENLQKLQITYSTLSVVTSEWEGIEFTPVTLPALDTLRLERLVQLRGSEPIVLENDSTIYQLLNTLVLPSLQIFTENSEPHTFNLQIILSLFQRSNCPSLTYFATSATIFEEQFLSFVQEYPGLRILELRGISTLTNRAIKLLTFRPQQPIIDGPCTLPYLKRLTLEGKMSFDAPLFVGMVESRIAAHRSGQDVCRMHEVKLQWTEDMLPEGIDALVRFSQDGLFRGLDFGVLFS